MPDFEIGAWVIAISSLALLVSSCFLLSLGGCAPRFLDTNLYPVGSMTPSCVERCNHKLTGQVLRVLPSAPQKDVRYATQAHIHTHTHTQTHTHTILHTHTHRHTHTRTHENTHGHTHIRVTYIYTHNTHKHTHTHCCLLKNRSHTHVSCGICI